MWTSGSTSLTVNWTELKCLPSFTIQVLKPTKEAADLSQPKSKADRATAETVKAESIKTVMTLKAYFCCLNSIQSVFHAGLPFVLTDFLLSFCFSTYVILLRTPLKRFKQQIKPAIAMLTEIIFATTTLFAVLVCSSFPLLFVCLVYFLSSVVLILSLIVYLYNCHKFHVSQWFLRHTMSFYQVCKVYAYQIYGFQNQTLREKVQSQRL